MEGRATVLARGLNSIHNRLFLLFLSCMMILLLVVSFIYYQKTTDIIHSKISDLAEKNISQTVGLFDLLLQGYDSVTKSLNSNNELIRLLEEHDASRDQAVSVMNERSITNILGAIYYSRNDIVGIHVMTSGGKSYNYERRFAGLMDANYSSSDWYKKLTDSSGEMVWLGIFHGSLINHLNEEPLFVFGRKLYDLNDHRTVGVMLIETNPSPIFAALSNVTISPNSRVYIVDRENRIVASSAKEQAKPPSFSGLPKPDTDQIIVDNQTDQLIVAAKAKLSDWTVLGLTPKEDINAEIVRAREYLYVVILVLVVLSTALASLVSRSMSAPLKLLIREMKQVEMGNFKGAVTVKSFEEINSLVSSFNRMVNRMDELIERITLSSISEKNAELQALQSQVNPHFLYNTLDMIYWMLDERENDRLGRVILALSHMFRYSSDWEEASKTTLRMELEQIQHYMTIIQSRLEGRVRTEIDVAPEWLDAVLPKMTIQPIIENAVKYGLEPLDRPGLLRVYAEANEKELSIVIEDNGVGMEEKVLRQIRESLLSDTEAASSLKTGRRGIGLTNVHRRLVHMYGEWFGLKIESTRGVGTTVTIVLPLMRKVQETGI